MAALNAAPRVVAARRRIDSPFAVDGNHPDNDAWISCGLRLRFARVKLSVKSDYAARAVLGLSRQYASGGAVKVEELAEEFGIPASFLVQILLELKAKHLVASVRGKEGGYLLAKPPAAISMGDVIRAIHGQVFDSPALSDPKCPPELSAAWRGLQATLDDAADRTTFQQLLDDAIERSKMWYI